MLDRTIVRANDMHRSQQPLRDPRATRGSLHPCANETVSKPSVLPSHMDHFQVTPPFSSVLSVGFLFYFSRVFSAHNIVVDTWLVAMILNSVVYRVFRRHQKF